MIGPKFESIHPERTDKEQLAFELDYGLGAPPPSSPVEEPGLYDRKQTDELRRINLELTEEIVKALWLIPFVVVAAASIAGIPLPEPATSLPDSFGTLDPEEVDEHRHIIRNIGWGLVGLPYEPIDEECFYDYCDEDMDEVFKEIEQVSATTITEWRSEAKFASMEGDTGFGHEDDDDDDAEITFSAVAQATGDRALLVEGPAARVDIEKEDYEWNEEDAELIFKNINVVLAELGGHQFLPDAAHGVFYAEASVHVDSEAAQRTVDTVLSKETAARFVGGKNYEWNEEDAELVFKNMEINFSEAGRHLFLLNPAQEGLRQRAYDGNQFNAKYYVR
ncbi:hypothetical protein BC835DRAFT_229220 [Cytidiella melzeri]|nr:hypothetical protein BC835DRAFT_229220 [Cytidiella melzeri]